MTIGLSVAGIHVSDGGGGGRGKTQKNNQILQKNDIIYRQKLVFTDNLAKPGGTAPPLHPATSAAVVPCVLNNQVFYFDICGRLRWFYRHF